MLQAVLNYLIPVLSLFFCSGTFTEIFQAAPSYSTVIQDNPSDKQLLLNGRIWWNQYSKAIGDPFFLANTILKGSVILNGQKFSNLDLMYDIANDELVLRVEGHPAIMINKEMVDSFSLIFENRNYHIINAGTDTSNILRGYVNVLYDGPSALYVKYRKKLQIMAVDGRYDLFYQEHHMYIRKGIEILPASGKRKILNLLEDKRKEIRDYMKSSRYKIMRNDPATVIPVLKYYDSLKEQDKRKK